VTYSVEIKRTVKGRYVWTLTATGPYCIVTCHGDSVEYMTGERRTLRRAIAHATREAEQQFGRALRLELEHSFQDTAPRIRASIGK
jgi:hypothetical protein